MNAAPVSAPSVPEVYILVSAIPGALEFALKRGPEIIKQSPASSLLEIHGYELRAGVSCVIVDGPDSPGLRAAARLFHWQLGPSLAALRAVA